MTDEEKLEAVEDALDGTRELIAEVRKLGAAFSYVSRTYAVEVNTFSILAESLAGLLDDRDWELMHRAEIALGSDRLFRLCEESRDSFDSEYPRNHRSRYHAPVMQVQP